jgi:hypothetical protein
MKYTTTNHNGRSLGEFDTLAAAQENCRFYTEQTGNPATWSKITRQRSAYKSLIRVALAAGYNVTVDGGGDEPDLSRSTNYREICENVAAVEEAEITLRDSTGAFAGWALIHPHADEEDGGTVIDHTVNAFLESWWQAFYSHA